MSELPGLKETSPRKLGDFEIVRELGRGGMGIVYEARQISLNRKVALKVLSAGLGMTTTAVVRFRREAEAAAKLHHTNIVPIYATGEADGTHYYAMELVEGPSLNHVIRQMRQTGTTEPPGATSEQTTVSDLPAWVAETFTKDAQVGPPSSDTAGDSSSTLQTGERYLDTAARFEDRWSRAFLTRLQQDPTWPRWIPIRPTAPTSNDSDEPQEPLTE